MNDLLEAMQIEVRIAAVDSVLMCQDLATRHGTTEIVHLREERMFRALTDERINLRGRQIDMKFTTPERRSA